MDFFRGWLVIDDWIERVLQLCNQYINPFTRCGLTKFITNFCITDGSGIFKGGLSWNAAGVVVGAIAAVFYAAFSIFSKLAMERGYRPLTVSFYSLLAAGIALAFFTDWSTVSAVTAQDPMGMTGFFVLHSLCTSVLPYVLYTVGLNYIDAGKASILASAEPVAATVFGIFFYHEIPGFAEIAGLILVMAALIYLSAPQEGRLTLKKHKEA